MAFSDQLAADAALLVAIEGLSDSVTYTEPNGQSTGLTVTLFGEQTETPDNDGIRTKLRWRACAWSTDQLSTVNLLAKITVNSEDWSIAQVVYQDDYQITVRLERHELIEHARQGYRRQ